MSWLKRLYLRWRYPEVCWKHMHKRNKIKTFIDCRAGWACPTRKWVCPICHDESIANSRAESERKTQRLHNRDDNLRKLGVTI